MADPIANDTPPIGRCPRKTSIAKASQQYKVKLDASHQHGKVNQVVSLMPLGEIIELIGVWNADGTDDGYDPFLKRSVREVGQFSVNSGIFRLADRRAPAGSDLQYEYLPSPQKARKMDGTPFPRHWYMRLVDPDRNEDSVEVRRKVAQSICNVSTLIVFFCLAVFADFAAAAAVAVTTTNIVSLQGEIFLLVSEKERSKGPREQSRG